MVSPSAAAATAASTVGNAPGTSSTAALGPLGARTASRKAAAQSRSFPLRHTGMRAPFPAKPRPGPSSTTTLESLQVEQPRAALALEELALEQQVDLLGRHGHVAALADLTLDPRDREVVVPREHAVVDFQMLPVDALDEALPALLELPELRLESIEHLLHLRLLVSERGLLPLDVLGALLPL